MRRAGLALLMLGTGCWAEVFLAGETDLGSTGGTAPGTSTEASTTSGTTRDTDAQPACDTEAEQAACDGDCVFLEEDSEHCGECGIVCDEDELCADGDCVFSCDCDPIYEVCNGDACECREGTELCAGECAPLVNDPTNCGGCGIACDDVCLDFDCEPECFTLDECDGACTDFDIDPLHCGGCGRECGSEEICAFGVCRDAEPAPFECDACPCDDYCEDLDQGLICCFSSVVEGPLCLDSPVCPE